MDMSADGAILLFIQLRSGMVVVSILNPSWWPGSLIQSDLMFGLDHYIRDPQFAPFVVSKRIISCQGMDFPTNSAAPISGFRLEGFQS